VRLDWGYGSLQVEPLAQMQHNEECVMENEPKLSPYWKHATRIPKLKTKGLA
jgi:hypothetical protein